MVAFVGVVDLVDGSIVVAMHSKSESVMAVSVLRVTRGNGLYTVNIKQCNVNLDDSQRVQFQNNET